MLTLSPPPILSLAQQALIAGQQAAKLRTTQQQPFTHNHERFIKSNKGRVWLSMQPQVWYSKAQLQDMHPDMPNSTIKWVLYALVYEKFIEARKTAPALYRKHIKRKKDGS